MLVRATLLSMFISGCASVPQESYWERTWEGALTTTTHIVASPWGPEVQGWTVCDKTKRNCEIFIAPTADYDCVKTHELKHAAGFDHPRYPRAFICP